MWNAVIELAIGLIVLYSLLSLVTSNVNELISSAFSRRGRNLLRAVKHMVGDKCGEDIYRHPLIRTLYADLPPGEDDTRMMAGLRRRLPSYIPAENFVIALLDSAAPSAVKAPPSLPPEPRVLIPTEPPAPERDEDDDAPRADAPAPAAPNWQKLIGDEVERISESRLQNTLRSLWVASSYDVVAFRAGVEDWFNHTMDRASGWYKRRTQALVLAFAMAIAVGLNVDTIHVAQRLWTDGTVRAAVAEEVERLPLTTSTTAPGTTGTTVGELQTRLEAIQRDIREVSGLGLPLGWGSDLTPKGVGGWARALLGWTITAIALSLGAPFWFDLLARVAPLRGSGTKERTPTQESRPRR